MRQGYVISLLSLTISFTALAQLPACTNPPPPIASLVIPYVGLSSGCSSAPGGNPNCVTGEVIQFKIGDGVQATDCYIEYQWNFGDGPVFGDATSSHAFASPGNYPVNLTIADAAGFHQFAVTVPVISASAIPVGTRTMLVLLVLTLAATAILRQR
jgi:hypothetical protein